ncbi:MAG: MBL fold metallo-hydrolase [Gammaproteobacteria bacterium]|nr:MBL fold metallo-hydrolase [Gammaproteobacteria bacterium]
MFSKLVRLVTSLCLASAASSCVQGEDEAILEEGPEREIIHIAGDLYEVRDPVHNTVFLVTSEGVIMGDPMGVESAQWIKEEIAERFNATVEYVIYSHHHPEHSTGGNVFADTATFVAHENTIAALNAPFPSNAGQMDHVTQC